MGSNRLSEEQLSSAMGMLELGLSVRSVARRFGVSASVISRARLRFLQTGSVRFRHGGGRPRATTARQDRLLAVRSRQNSFVTARTLQMGLLNATGVRVSTQTIRRRLQCAGLRSRRGRKYPILSRIHKQRRLEWARNHDAWTIEQWRDCVISDEIRIRLRSNDRRARRFSEENLQNDHASGGGSVTIWGAISLNRRIPLVVFGNESLTALKYLNEVLVPVVLPLAQEIGDNFVYIDDNARAHRAPEVNSFFADNFVARISWPPQSPDLDLIEHVWNYLKRQIRARRVDSSNIQEFQETIVEEWNKIPDEVIRNVIESIPSRVEAIIRTNGGPTQYW